MIQQLTALTLMAAAVSASAGGAPPDGAGVQATDDAKLAKRLDGLSAGKPVACIPVQNIQDIQLYNGTAVYMQGSSRIWTNQTLGGCDNRRDDIIVSRTSGGSYCRGDIIQLRSRSSGFFTGSCALGDFVPYSRP